MNLISHKHNFIFIHIIKTGGGSITRALHSYGHQISHHHGRAYMVRDEIGEATYHHYFSFCFVRNPWDWLVSLYTYMSTNQRHYAYKSIKDMSFDQFLEWEMGRRCIHQSDWFLDKSGKQIITFIGRFERIRDDFMYICQKIGINGALSHMNPSPRIHYRSYYNERTKKMVYDRFRKDIDLLSYSF